MLQLVATMAFAILAGAGCSNSATAAPAGTAAPLAALTGGGPALKKHQYNTTVTSFDGAQIGITVFVPDAPANTPVPLIVVHPGWAVPRARSLNATWSPFYFAPQEAAKLANDNGYYVISFDERGFYSSTGSVELSDPNYEGRDVSAILDWAEANLAPQLAYRDGKLVSGSLGLSYGAGTQIVAAMVDSRVSAIVPTAVWNTLPTSLAPNWVPKSAWSATLYWTALAGSFGRLDPRLKEAYDEQLKGSVDPNLLNTFQPNGLGGYCDGTVANGYAVPKIPVMLVQGEADTLFNMNQAVANASCLRAAGDDVRLLIQHFGHTLRNQPDVPYSIFGLEKQVQCGGQNFDLGQAMYSFLDEKIRGSAPQINVPQNCITLDPTHGLTPASIPTGNYAVQFNSTALVTNAGGRNAISGRDTATASTATWIPLYTATSQRPLAGIPHITMDLSAPAGSSSAYALIGIGVQTAGSSAPVLVDTQFMPFRGAGHYDEDLVGIAQLLQPGDAVGLLVYGYDAQYSNVSKSSTLPGTVSGTLKLPLP